MSSLTKIVDQYSENENIESYLERFEVVCDIEEVKDEIEMSKHLTVCGGQLLYEKMKIVTHPQIPMKVKYSELKPKLISTLKQAKLVNVEKTHFYSRVQKNGETVSEFAFALKKIAANCDFGSFLDMSLRDRFVFNLSNDYVSRHTIKSNKKTFDEAVAEALLHETAINNSHSSVSVDQISKFGNKSRQNHRQRQFKGPRNTTSFKPNHSSFKPNHSYNCRTCGRSGGHGKRKCPAVVEQWPCYVCHKKGHTSVFCRLKGVARQWKNNNLHEQVEESVMSQISNLQVSHKNTPGESFSINMLNTSKNHTRHTHTTQTMPPLLIKFYLNGIQMYGEVDTGACVSVISHIIYETHFSHIKLMPVDDKNFSNADGRACEIIGKISVCLNFKHEVQVIVMKSLSSVKPLIGRTILDVMCPSWRDYFCQNLSEMNEICVVENNEYVEKILVSYADIFKPSQEPILGVQVNLELKNNFIPKFCKCSVIPFALRDQVANYFKDKSERGIITYVKESQWASQIVIVPKKDGNIRVCCNYKNTLNPQLRDDKYPLPVIDDLLTELGDGEYFSVLDLEGAYAQLLLDEKSRPLTTVNTPLGLYMFNRLPFGVKTAPAIFQSTMDRILNGLTGVSVYFDDIIVRSRTIEEGYERLESVLKRLRAHNVHCSLQKCVFFQRQVSFLGHEVSGKGIGPSSQKVKAIMKMPPPKNLTQLRSFLGAVNFYSKFIRNLQSDLHPLHKLLCKDAKFDWSVECQRVFEEVKNKIVTSQWLVHFDPSKPISLICDAGPYGVGAVLNITIDNVERPCYFVSSSLSAAEKNYAQLHREALAIVFAVKKLHKFIYGHEVIVYTDCKSLESLLSKEKNLDCVINSRFVRWILFLQGYNLTVKFRPSSQTKCADMLSRLPINESTEVEDVKLNISNVINIINENSEENVKFDEIKKEMKNNVLCRQLYEYVLNGWPEKRPKNLERFWQVKNSLDIQDECIFYGERAFIPPKLRFKFLKMIHKEHSGIVRSKQIARQSIWWPNLDKDIEDFVKECRACQLCDKRQSKESLKSWPKAQFPFERIHLDHFQFENSHFLIIFDVFTSWVHIELNKSESTECVLLSLRKFIAIFGLPSIIVSDNGTSFSSRQFIEFCESNNIIVKKSPPWHPQSNEAAERQVGIVKQNLKKFLIENKHKNMSIECQLQNYLFKSHTTPLADNLSPANKVFKYDPVTNLSIFQKSRWRPSPQSQVGEEKCWKEESRQRVESRQSKSSKNERSPQSRSRSQEMKSDKSKFKSQVMKSEKFQSSQPVYVWYPRGPTNYVEGHIIERVSSLIYKVRLRNGHVLCVHVDSLKERNISNYLPLQDSTLPERTYPVRESKRNRSPNHSPPNLRKKRCVDFRRYF